MLLLHDAIQQRKKADIRFQAALQGVNLPEDDEVSDGPDDLPPEVLEHEREWQKKKAEHLANGQAEQAKMEAMGIGYVRQ